MNGTRRHVLCDQCVLFGELNLALPNTPPHKPALSASFIKVCDRLDVLHGGCQKKSLSGCSGGVKPPCEGGHNAHEQTPSGNINLGETSVLRGGAAADSFSPSWHPPHCFIPQPPSFFRSMFLPRSCFFFVPIWYGLLMCFHVSVNTHWV